MIVPLKPLEKMWRGETCAPIRLPVGRLEAEARLKKKIASFGSAFRHRGLTGSLKNGRISVFWNTPGLGNAWRPVFRGFLREDGQETTIEGTFSTFRFTQGFSIVWFGFIGIFAVRSFPTIVGPIAAVAMMLLGIGMIAFGQHISRAEKEKIVAALQTLE